MAPEHNTATSNARIGFFLLVPCSHAGCGFELTESNAATPATGRLL
jgi:hypothetical protein